MMQIKQALEQLQEIGGEELVRDIVTMFLEDTPRKLAQAGDAARAGDAKTAMRAVHSLKSTSGQIGLESLSALCGRLESMAKDSALSGFAPMLVDAERLFNATTSRLKRIIQPGATAS